MIPTCFGRLIFVARLRDADGHYNYRPLVESMGREIADRTLANSHYHVFAEWIASALANQKADFEEYLRGRDAGEIAAYGDLVPSTAHEVERQLYLTDLETLLVLLRFSPAGAASTRKSSPHP